ncbi:hypothetical protein ACFW9L_28290 [Streptomyces sp. NPDC059517]|uniref:hypothetical protein n=1 Tax=Streptomyces sp. NPDC059517 TaxID=3346855 RepID=UPI003678B554
MRWKDLLWCVQTPPSTAAWLDWPTGLVHINATKAEWDAAAAESAATGSNAPGAHPEWELLAQSLSHENVHFMQCVTTGYMYRWAFEHFRLLADGLTELGYPFAEVGDVKKALLAAEQIVSAGTAEALRGHTAKLNVKGPYGLTVRHLVEAHALCVEQLMHTEPVDAKILLHRLDTTSPNADYRLAYDMCRFWLGNARAFDSFLALITVSLCTDSPPEAFVRLLAEVAAHGLTDDAGENVEIIRQIADEVANDLLIGSAAEVWSPHQGEHPVYGPAVRRLNELAEAGDFSMHAFMVDPVSSIETLIDEVVRPTLFRPSEEGVFAIQLPTRISERGQEAEEEMRVLLLVSALGNRIHQVAHEETESEIWSVPEFFWLCETVPEIRLLEISSKWLQDAEEETLTAILDARRIPLEKRQQTVRIWGCCVLNFPTAVMGTSPRDAGVRRFVRTLHSRMPSFPLYLEFTDSMGMFFLWFGALADSDAWSGATQLNIAHPSVVLRVGEAVSCMREAGRMLQYDVSPQVDRLLSHYPPEMGRELSAALE